tara:strand:+ start:2439 stop:2636 length:198 start_codon:yes stop_codon:yes gene_type:complete
VSIPKRLIFFDRNNMVGSVGRVDDPSVSQLAGAVESKGEVGGAGISFDVVAVGGGGKKEAEKFIF